MRRRLDQPLFRREGRGAVVAHGRYHPAPPVSTLLRPSWLRGPRRRHPRRPSGRRSRVAFDGCSGPPTVVCAVGTGSLAGNDSSSASSSWRSTSARLSRLCAFTGSFMLEPLRRASPAGCGKPFLHQRAELGQILGHEKLSVHYVIVSKDERRHYLVERRGFKP